MLTWLALPMAIRNINIMLTRKGKPLNAALAGTGQLALVYALLFFASALLVSFFRRGAINRASPLNNQRTRRN